MRTINQYVLAKKNKLKITTVGVGVGLNQFNVLLGREEIVDINIYHGIDIEDELVRMLTEEIDRNILNDIFSLR
jgi:hypothetical protein